MVLIFWLEFVICVCSVFSPVVVAKSNTTHDFFLRIQDKLYHWSPRAVSDTSIYMVSLISGPCLQLFQGQALSGCSHQRWDSDFVLVDVTHCFLMLRRTAAISDCCLWSPCVQGLKVVVRRPGDSEHCGAGGSRENHVSSFLTPTQAQSSALWALTEVGHPVG